LRLASPIPGEFITLGINEADDLEAVIAYLRRDMRVSKVALWGRSMGAATAVLYAQRDPSVAALVLDSSFSRCARRLPCHAHARRYLETLLTSHLRPYRTK
jgi:pimeloyl-ACP methyl ester carboxylesterase